MTVYVDRERNPFGRMIMCHMVADTDAELHGMARRIGVSRRHHQKAGTPHSHYDICLSMRAKALAFGAVEIDRRRLVGIIESKRRQAAAKEAL